MGSHIIIFLFLLYILHERTYFSYRPFFWCFANPHEQESVENPAFVPESQISDGKEKYMTEALSSSGLIDVKDDVSRERSEVHRMVECMDSCVCFFSKMYCERVS